LRHVPEPIGTVMVVLAAGMLPVRSGPEQLSKSLAG